MQSIINFMNKESFILILSIIVLILIFGFIYVLISNIKLNKKYKKFMKKIGNGKNIEEDLENYMVKVEKIEKQNDDITIFCKNIDNEMSKCIQKIGIVRYSAFKDTGSDLSFALALLDEENNGVVLNGIYSREISNIYAKPVKNAKSEYTLSDEEIEAINKAVNSNSLYKVR